MRIVWRVCLHSLAILLFTISAAAAFPASCKTVIGDGRGLSSSTIENNSLRLSAFAVDLDPGSDGTPIVNPSFSWWLDSRWDASIEPNVDDLGYNTAVLRTGSKQQWLTVHVQAFELGVASGAPGSEGPGRCREMTVGVRVDPNYQSFLAIGTSVGRVFNQESPGATILPLSSSWRTGYEFSFASLPLLAEADWRGYHYHHATLGIGSSQQCTNGIQNPGCVTLIGFRLYQTKLGFGQYYLPDRVAIDQDADLRLSAKVLNPRIYVGLGYAYRHSDDMNPSLYGFGWGVEKLPDLDQPLSPDLSEWQYVSMSATYRAPVGSKYGGLSGISIPLRYSVLKYRVGFTSAILAGHVYLESGVMGDKGFGNSYAPSDFTHHALYAGIVIRFN